MKQFPSPSDVPQVPAMVNTYAPVFKQHLGKAENGVQLFAKLDDC